MKNILVTGVSRGMGKATAELLIHEGYFVYGVYNSNKSEADKLVEKLKNIKVFQCDLSDRENIKKLVKDIGDIQIDGIVNSAGVFLPIEFDTFDESIWDKTFEINLNAPVLLVNYLRNNLSSGSSIVNIASTDGMVGSISGIAYSASKAALINITQSLANILAPKRIRVNVIAPGWIGDGMQADEELLKEAASLNPLKRSGTYEEIANVVNFLLSDKASYITGSTIVVDGGDTATNYILQKEAGLS